MKILFLSGYGIDLSVDSGRLVIKDGQDLKKEPSEVVLKPKGDDFDGIVVCGHSGNVSLDAMKWLSKQNIPLTILNWDGRMLANVLIPEMKQGIIRMAQYDAYRDGRRLVIAKAFIEANEKWCGGCDLNTRTPSGQNLKSCAVGQTWLPPLRDAHGLNDICILP